MRRIEGAAEGALTLMTFPVKAKVIGDAETGALRAVPNSRRRVMRSEYMGLL